MNHTLLRIVMAAMGVGSVPWIASAAILANAIVGYLSGAIWGPRSTNGAEVLKTAFSCLCILILSAVLLRRSHSAHSQLTPTK